MDHFTEIIAAYRKFVDEDLGQARATVRTAAPLTDAEKQELGRRLEGAARSSGSSSRSASTRRCSGASSPRSAATS